MIVNTAPCFSSATIRPSLNTYAAMKKPTTIDITRSRKRSAFIAHPYRFKISAPRKKD